MIGCKRVACVQGAMRVDDCALEGALAARGREEVRGGSEWASRVLKLYRGMRTAEEGHRDRSGGQFVSRKFCGGLELIK